MNRSINFSAWDKETKTLYDSIYELYFENGALKEIIFEKTFEGGEETVVFGHISNVELLQYLNKQDRNNKEIREGDIVQIDDDYPEDDPCHNAGYNPTGVVVYKDVGFYVESDDKGFYDNMGMLFSWDESEVLGNIYQNPELVGVSCE